MKIVKKVVVFFCFFLVIGRRNVGYRKLGISKRNKTRSFKLGQLIADNE